MDNVVVNIRRVQGELCCVDSITRNNEILCEFNEEQQKIDFGLFYKVQDDINHGVMITRDNQGNVLSENKISFYVEQRDKGYVLNYEKSEE